MAVRRSFTTIFVSGLVQALSVSSIKIFLAHLQEAAAEGGKRLLGTNKALLFVKSGFLMTGNIPTV